MSVASAQAKAATPDVGTPSTAGKVRILIVDDEPSMREMLRIVLRRDGYDVQLANTGREAIDQLRQNNFDLLLSDIKMPDVSGVDVLRAAKEINRDVVAFMMTAYASTSTAVEAMRLGAHNYVSKPADADDVLAAVMGDARPVDSGSNAAAPPPTLARAEWEHIQRILSDTGGNVSETARRLGITRRTLQLKLKKYPPRV